MRTGGRYREITVLARNLQSYHEPLVNVFNRYEIPFFLDRRESVSHHPLAELARNALRTVASSWQTEDWFAALKTGLVPAAEGDIDRLENEALARGWKGGVWHQPLTIPDEPELARELEARAPEGRSAVSTSSPRIGLGQQPTGAQLAEALREFWQTLNVAGNAGKMERATGRPASDSSHRLGADERLGGQRGTRL